MRSVCPRTRRLALTLGIALTAAAIGVRADDAADALRAGFRALPQPARPTVYWLWLNGYVNRAHIERELRAFRDAGIGGVLIFDMGARGDRKAMPPPGSPFMSDRFVDDVAAAVRIAGRLGLDVQLAVSSSWDMGGAWVEPRHASMGLFTSELAVTGPQQLDAVLPFPVVPRRTPRRDDGRPVFLENSAVLAYPTATRQPGHDFVFRLDPRGVHALSHAVLHNTLSGDTKKYGDKHLFTRHFSIAVSATDAGDASFREVLHASLEPTAAPQRFDLAGVKARYVRLRLVDGHNERFERIQLGEFELFDRDGVNLVGSHAADRSRDGAELLVRPPALGHDRSWTTGNIHDGAKSGPGGSWSSVGLPPVRIAETASIVDLTDRIDSNGRVQWDVPEGDWIIQRYVCTNTGETLKVPSPQSDGLATDHFSEEATRVFLGELVRRLQAKLGDLGATALKQLYLASYEVRGPVWTPEMLSLFRRYRGYDMTPYLPALSGNVVVDQDTTRRFLYDYRKTLGQLLVDAYYRAAVDVAHDAGVGIESEAGGPGPPIHNVPVDALEALGAIDEVRGEFWPRRPNAHRLWVVKEIACAAHIYGKRRVHMEAFTSMHHWQDGPIDLKPSADRAFCEGANHFVWHTSVHLPPEAGEPGWMYLAGTHLNTRLVWWPKAKAFLDYLARCSFLLQQGHFVADVCYYYGDQGFNFVPPKHVDPSLGPGFDYDVTNRRVILERMSVRDGRIVLPDGMSYELLVLPDRDDIDFDVPRALERLVRDGATIVGPKPTRSNGLGDVARTHAHIREIADRMWGACDGKTVLANEYGRGRVIHGRELRDVLRDRGVGPDVTVHGGDGNADIDFVHRRTDREDIYFVSNQSPKAARVEVEFRVGKRGPELWDAATGETTRQYAYRRTENGVAVPLELAGNGSIFVVFRHAEKPLPGLSLDAAVSDAHDDAWTPRIASWDGRRARVAVFAPGAHRLSVADGRVATVAPLVRRVVDVSGPWSVQFRPRRGAPFAKKLERLTSWTDQPDDAVRYFSGTAEYQTTFELSAAWLDVDRRTFLDLGTLWAVGDVRLNGSALGVVWKPPYVLDVTAHVRVGRNELVVEVANTWSNRLVGDARLPASERKTRTNVPRSGGRAWRDVPLLRSGLFGPVRVVPARVVTVEPR